MRAFLSVLASVALFNILLVVLDLVVRNTVASGGTVISEGIIGFIIGMPSVFIALVTAEGVAPNALRSRYAAAVLMLATPAAMICLWLSVQSTPIAAPALFLVNSAGLLVGGILAAVFYLRR